MNARTTGDHDKAVAAADVRSAVQVEILTIAWMVVEALVAIGSGIAASSLLLVAFGADSVIELLSAVVLYRRLSEQLAKGFESKEEWEAKERQTARWAGILLFALSAYVVVQAIYGLWTKYEPENSWLGIAITVVAAVGMPILARVKLRVSRKINSRALRADAMESWACAYLAWAVLAGLVAFAISGWWWLDAAVSLAIVPLLLKEAREAFSGEDDDDDDDDDSDDPA